MTSGAPWRAPSSFDEDVHLFVVGDRIGVVGRYDSGGPPALASWSPADARWTKVDDLPETREGCGFAWLPDGTVVAAGGYGYNEAATTSLIRRPDGEWIAVSTGALGETHAAPLADGRVLVVAEDSALVLDPATLRRTPLSGVAPASAGVGRGPDGLVFAGGSDGDRAHSTVVRWDADGPHPLPDLPAPRVGPTVAVAVDGRIAVVGGTTSADGGDPEASALLFDGAAWSVVALPKVRREPAVVWLGDGSLLIVGDDGAERIERGTVTTVPHTGASGGAAALPDGRALVVGGGVDSRDAATFDPALGRFRRAGPAHPEVVGRLDGRLVALGSRAGDLSTLFSRMDADGAWTELAPLPGAPGFASGSAWAHDGEHLWRYQAGEDVWTEVRALSGGPVYGTGGVWTVDGDRLGRVIDGRTFSVPHRWGTEPVVLEDGALLVGAGNDGEGRRVPAVLVDDAPREVEGLPEGEGSLVPLPNGGALWFGVEGGVRSLDVDRRRFVEVPPPPVLPPGAPFVPWVLPDGQGAIVGGLGRFESGQWTPVAPPPVQAVNAVLHDERTAFVVADGVWTWDPHADPRPAKTSAPPSRELLAQARPPLGPAAGSPPTCAVRPSPAPLDAPGRVAALRSGSRVVVIGGRVDRRSQSDVEGWDGDEPIALPALPEAPDEPAGTGLTDGGVLVVGAGGATEGAAWWLDRDRWTAVPLPAAADEPSVVALPGGAALAVAGASWHKPAMENAWRFERGRWTPVPFGGQPVANPAVVALGDGRVLVVGGRIPEWWGSGPDAYAADARVYRDGRFEPTAPLAQARAFATATRMGDGRVLVVGGIAGDPDPPADEDGMVRVMDLGSRAKGLASAEIWDPKTGRWSAAADLQVGRWHHAAGLLPDGTVLVVGGVAGDDSGPGLDAERYDPSTNAWTAVPLRVPRKDAAIVDVDGGLWVVGGRQGSYDVGEIEAFGAGACSVGTAPVARDEPVLVPLDDGSIVLLGAWDQRAGRLPIERWVDGRWSVAGSLSPTVHDRVAARLSDGTVLVVGGVAERWDPKSGATRALDLPVVEAVIVRLTDGRALVLGEGSDRPVAATLDPTTDRWTPVTPPPVVPVLATLLADGRVLAGADGVAWVWDPADGAGWSSQEVGLAWSREDTLDLLPDGRVLHVSPVGIEILEREGAWTSLGTRYARFRHDTLVMDDGRVWLVGGLARISADSGGYVADDVDPNAPLVSWDPRTGVFEKRETELWSWYDGAVTRLADGRWLLVGGRSDVEPGADPLGQQILPDPDGGR